MHRTHQMQRTHRWMVVVPIVAGLQLAACHTSSSKPVKIKPAQVEHVEGTELSRVTLTAKAAERLDIQTAPVREAQVARSVSPASVREAQMAPSGSRRKLVPYAAVLYDTHGITWVYTSPEPLVFVRHRITIDHITGDLAVLSDGPPVGTRVVTVGGAELFGAEFEIGH
jgi:hypothetical protein